MSSSESDHYDTEVSDSEVSHSESSESEHEYQPKKKFAFASSSSEEDVSEDEDGSESSSSGFDTSSESDSSSDSDSSSGSDDSSSSSSDESDSSVASGDSDIRRRKRRARWLKDSDESDSDESGSDDEVDDAKRKRLERRKAKQAKIISALKKSMAKDGSGDESDNENVVAGAVDEFNLGISLASFSESAVENKDFTLLELFRRTLSEAYSMRGKTGISNFVIRRYLSKLLVIFILRVDMTVKDSEEEFKVLNELVTCLLNLDFEILTSCANVDKYVVAMLETSMNLKFLLHKVFPIFKGSESKSCDELLETIIRGIFRIENESYYFMQNITKLMITKDDQTTSSHTFSSDLVCSSLKRVLSALNGTLRGAYVGMLKIMLHHVLPICMDLFLVLKDSKYNKQLSLLACVVTRNVYALSDEDCSLFSDCSVEITKDMESYCTSVVEWFDSKSMDKLSNEFGPFIVFQMESMYFHNLDKSLNRFTCNSIRDIMSTLHPYVKPVSAQLFSICARIVNETTQGKTDVADELDVLVNYLVTMQMNLTALSVESSIMMNKALVSYGLYRLNYFGDAESCFNSLHDIVSSSKIKELLGQSINISSQISNDLQSEVSRMKSSNINTGIFEFKFLPLHHHVDIEEIRQSYLSVVAAIDIPNLSMIKYSKASLSIDDGDCGKMKCMSLLSSRDEKERSTIKSESDVFEKYIESTMSTLFIDQMDRDAIVEITCKILQGKESEELTGVISSKLPHLELKPELKTKLDFAQFFAYVLPLTKTFSKLNLSELYESTHSGSKIPTSVLSLLEEKFGENEDFNLYTESSTTWLQCNIKQNDPISLMMTSGEKSSPNDLYSFSDKFNLLSEISQYSNLLQISEDASEDGANDVISSIETAIGQFIEKDEENRIGNLTRISSCLRLLNSEKTFESTMNDRNGRGKKGGLVNLTKHWRTRK